MHLYCENCNERLSKSGFVHSLYELICETYLVHGFPIAIRESICKRAIHYLEINDFIVTTEAIEDYIFAKPNLIALDDGDTYIFCNGNCMQSVIDFNEE